MEGLLNYYLLHHGLPEQGITNFVIKTDYAYFEIDDSDSAELVVHMARGGGTAKFENNHRLTLKIVNYDKFVSSLPHSFQRGKKRCDFLLSGDIKFFVLGELKDRNPKNNNARKSAREQLTSSLRILLDVPEISRFVDNKSIRRCCYFNKQSKSPAPLYATRAFNRLNATFSDGFKMPNKEIESLGFEFFEYTGEQCMTLTG